MQRGDREGDVDGVGVAVVGRTEGLRRVDRQYKGKVLPPL